MFRHFGHIQYKIEKCVKNNSGHVFFLEIFVPIDYLFVTLQPKEWVCPFGSRAILKCSRSRREP